jgi:hypothetical protein
MDERSPPGDFFPCALQVVNDIVLKSKEDGIVGGLVIPVN